MLTFISADWLKPLLKKLLHDQQRNREIIEIADIFSDPVQLAKYYVQPKCQHHNPADSDEDEVRSEIDIPVFNILNKFMDKEVAVRDGRHQMFILSDAGMGKTSLLVMLKLMHLTAFWPKGYGCVLLKLGQDTLDKVKDIENKKNTLLLLDSLDEDPLVWGRIKERLLELLENTSVFHRVIISCRTQFFPEKDLDPFGSAGRVVVGGFRCPMLFLSLFDEERVGEYLHKRFPTAWYQFTPQRKKAEKNRRNALEILDKMGSLRFRSLLLAHIEDLVDAPKQDWDAYRIYNALINIWLHREERKIRMIHKEAEKLPNKDDLLKSCIKIAEFMQHKGTKTLEEDELQNLIAADSNMSYLKNFNMGGRSLLNRNSDRAYRFSHYIIQEFLLACGIIEGYLGSEPLSATDQILYFLELSGCDGRQLSSLDFREFLLGKFLLKYKRPKRKLQRVDLKGINLSDAYLYQADLSNSNLNNANLENADLREANLRSANLSNANLENANLENAVLTGTILEGANLKSAVITIPFLSGDSHARCENLSKFLQVSHEKYPDPTNNIWTLILGEQFPINLNRCLVFFPADNSTSKDCLSFIKNQRLIREQMQVVVILHPDTAQQTILHQEVNNFSNLLVAPDINGLIVLLQSPVPLNAFASIIAAQISLARISPYETGGGVDKEPVFFGRAQLLAHIINRDLANYLVVGGRQLGKSSLLKALDRRYADHLTIACHYLSLTSDDVTMHLARELGLSWQASLKEILDHIAFSNTKKIHLFLIDEADEFVQAESERGYATLKRLRGLSEEGRCYFILAGYWHLYRHAALDYQSPLKNFGETLVIGALEEDACRKLATEPMSSMNIQYADEKGLERLLEATGQRANLISISCNEILRKLDIYKRFISAQDVEISLRSEAMRASLSGWQEAAGDNEMERQLARIIVYATIDKSSFSLADLLDELGGLNVNIIPERIEKIVERLTLAYVICQKKGIYRYSVSLFCEHILEKEPSRLLQQEIRTLQNKAKLECISPPGVMRCKTKFGTKHKFTSGGTS